MTLMMTNIMIVMMMIIVKSSNSSFYPLVELYVHNFNQIVYFYSVARLCSQQILKGHKFC